MFPIAEETVPYFKEKNIPMIIVQTLKLSVPASYVWLMVFYSLFHTFLNITGEITMFGDRSFYQDWWNAGHLGEYWRKWNLPVHNFLFRHIYYPLRRRNCSKTVSQLVVFLLSAALHEYVVIGIFRVVNFVAFTLMIINVPIIVI